MRVLEAATYSGGRVALIGLLSRAREHAVFDPRYFLWGGVAVGDP